MPRTPEEIVHEWIAAFNDPNIERLLALYHDDAVHYSYASILDFPEENGFLKKTKMKQWWEKCFRESPTLHYDLDLTELVIQGGDVYFGYKRTADKQPDLFVKEYLRIE